MDNNQKKRLSRRDFLKLSKNTAIAAGVIGLASNWIWLKEGLAAVPASEGYLLVDTKKCQGCISCMLACSLVHEGAANPSLSRIQIMQNSFSSFPDDVMIAQCRQCVDPLCVDACPVGALKADPAYGYVRMVAKDACVGCGRCMNACPFTPSRPVVAADESYGGARKSRKCDLCASAPFHWDDAGGGPNGKQACVEVCPVGAIRFTSEIPVQDDTGYYVNLRDDIWKSLGYPID